jgi:hypothetical protein
MFLARLVQFCAGDNDSIKLVVRRPIAPPARHRFHNIDEPRLIASSSMLVLVFGRNIWSTPVHCHSDVQTASAWRQAARGDSVAEVLA